MLTLLNLPTLKQNRKREKCYVQATSTLRVKHLILEQLQDLELSGYVLDNTSYTEGTKMSHNPEDIYSPHADFSRLFTWI